MIITPNMAKTAVFTNSLNLITINFVPFMWQPPNTDNKYIYNTV